MDQCVSGALIIQSAVFDVEKERCTSKKYDVNVQLLPARSGRAVSVEISSDNGASFSSITSGSDNGSGTTALSFNAPDKAGTYLYRAHAGAFPPLVAGSSGAIEAKVSPCGSDVINDALPVSRPGAERSCLLDANGDAWCWGNNQTGAIGDGTFTNRLKAVRVAGGHKFVSLTAGAEHTCAVKADGTGWCWGNNGSPGVEGFAQSGQGGLGDGTKSNRNVPTAITGGLKFKKLSAGINHTCGIDQFNQAYCWGANDFSQLGLGTEPVQNRSADVLVPTRINSSKNYIDIDVHGFQSCAMTANKEVDCWGDNAATTYSGNKAIPPEISKIITQKGSGYTRIALGTSQRCGLLPTGTIQCWQDERSGSFGDGSTEQYGQDPINTIGGPYTYLSFGNKHGCGVVSNGDGFCWGYNFTGELGNGGGDDMADSRSTPQLIMGGLKWNHVAVGYGHTCGISIGGNAYCWGSNFKGQLGNGTTRQYATKAPTSVIFLQ